MNVPACHRLAIPLCLFALLLVSCTAPSGGPLRVSEVNPRYFTDAGGKAILLTGSHTWNNLVDMGPTDPPPKFDWDRHLDWLQQLGHNYTRMWAWELLTWSTSGNNPKNRNKAPEVHYVYPHRFARTGPGTALDGKPKFDLTKFNDAYFQRLRTRLESAATRGLYVSIMLFEGWGMQRSPNAWENHPFHPNNNINGIDGNANSDSSGVEVHELMNSDVLALQEAYVRKVIDTVNDLDNVLYEISNENHGPASTPFQYHMIDFIHAYEQSKPKQHPVGMTYQFKGGTNTDLFDSPAEWISPNGEGGYRDNPPANDGRKVILSDTDHLWGIGGGRDWMWKSFCRGMNPIFMDPYDGLVLGLPFDEQWDGPRQSMGYAHEYADRMNLIAMTPQNDLASTGYCLANPGVEYLVYLPEGGEATVDLSPVSDSVTGEWFNPENGERRLIPTTTGGQATTLESPFGEMDAVLYLAAE
jgi:hypothetical protein